MYCEAQGRNLERLSLEDYRRFSPLFDEDIREINVWASVRARNVPGGTAPARVSQAIRRARTILRRREAEG